MVRIQLDPELCRQLGEADQTAELCDAAGRVIGYFLPQHAPSGVPPAGLEVPLDSEEIARRRRGPRGRSLGEILDGLSDGGPSA